MAKAPPSLPPFFSGNSLFVFQGDHVRALGEEGTEARIPLEDLRALLERLLAEEASPFSPDPGLTSDEGET